MNSAEDITVYKSPPEFYTSPTFSKRTTLGYSYDFSDKPAKKGKKWSIGSLFRRKKKDESESSSQEEQKKGFLGRRRRRSDGKRRKPKTVGGFDHILLPKSQNAYNGYNHHEDTGILSDPSGGFSNYSGRSLHLPSQNRASQPQSTNTSITNLNHSVASMASIGSSDSTSKKKGKDLMKARAAARRTTIRNESSSDEDSSLRSNSSLKIRSDESLPKLFLDASHNRRSRAARTERYLKRHSKDGENPNTYIRVSKSDADEYRSPSRSPLPVSTKPYLTSINSFQLSNMSGLSTIPPSHGVHGKYKISNSTSNPSYKPPLSMNEYNNSVNKHSSIELDKSLHNQRSISCDGNIHEAPSFEDKVVHVQFPILKPHTRGYRNLSLIDSSLLINAKQPPQPPPRDPNRTVLPHNFENGRPSTVYTDNNSRLKSKSFYIPNTVSRFLQPSSGSFHLNPSDRSISEVHIPNDPFQIPTPIRPASTIPEPKPNRYLAKHKNERHTVDGFNYLADKKPRSRKPIVIQSSTKIEPRKDSPTQKALDFWKQIEESVTKSCPKPTNNSLNTTQISKSPQIFTSQTHVQSQVFFPNAVQDGFNRLEPPRNSSPFKPVSPTASEIKNTQANEESPKFNINLSNYPKDDVTRKSCNLEEALDELEAIYSSLRLGDENLLDRAEQRENESLVKKAEEKKRQAYLGCGGGRGTLSDSSFSYEPFDQVDSPKKKKMVKKGKIPDTKEDDMYNRKIVKEKSATISNPQLVLSNASYLLSSPLYNTYDSEGELKKCTKVSNQPDITFDDLVYRNVKRANASPKIVELQPPFGIPLRPVSPAPNSDYLHASTEAIYTPAYIPKKIPDVVKDDLAFRALRKDSNKEPVLPAGSGNKIKNNHCPQEKKLDLNYLKKRRAFRSLSANIGNILGKRFNGSDEDVENEFKSKTLTDIADAMEIARRVLQEKGKNISNTRKAFMSDTDAKPSYIKGDSFKESRIKFLNGLKGQDSSQDQNSAVVRLPKGLKSERKLFRSPTKEPTLIPKSALADTGSTNSSLDDLLNALAEEAKVTTERITKELKELEEKKSRPNLTIEKNDAATGNKSDSCENLKPCQKLLKVVVDSSNLVEYSKSPCEVVKEIEVHSPPAESANIIQSCFKDSSEERKVQSDEHDYETIDSEEDKIDLTLLEKQEGTEEFKKCQSPFEERKAELVASFQDLKNNIDEIKIPSFDAKKTDSIYDNLDDTPSQASVHEDEGEHRFDACRTTDRPSNPNNSQVLSSNVNFLLKHSDAEHSSCDNAKLDSLESLKSPKLVLETSRKCSTGTDAVPKSSNMVLELSRSSSNSANSSNNDLSRPSTSGTICRPRSSSHGNAEVVDHIPKKSGELWYHDPAKVALACSYGVACAHQLASIDLATVFSLLFAVMSVFVALFL